MRCATAAGKAVSTDAGYGAYIHELVKKNLKPSALKLVLQAEEVDMPKLGGALIPCDEKLFPESEAGRMDPVG